MHDDDGLLQKIVERGEKVWWLKQYRLIIAIFIGIIIIISALGILAALDVNEFENKKLKVISEHIVKRMEYAYMEGQKDALEGDVRIEKGDSVWTYIKTPWDSDSVTIIVDGEYCTVPRGIPSTTAPVKENE